MLSVNTIIQKRWQKEDITEDSMAVSISKDYSLSKGLDVARKGTSLMCNWQST